LAIRIEEKFQVEAPKERVWAFLLDPHKVVACAPGAQLTEVVDDRTFKGNVRVKVGMITASYSGQAHLEEVDEAAGLVRMLAQGKESAGSGSARATLQARVRPLSDSATEVEVTADIDVVGRLMQFGRGMVQDVSRQLFRQFVACVKQQLENPEAGAPPKSGEPISGISLAAEAARSSLGRLMGRLRKGDRET
jgi:carbon monoxide dehydrogenase subunit G